MLLTCQDYRLLLCVLCNFTCLIIVWCYYYYYYLQLLIMLLLLSSSLSSLLYMFTSFVSNKQFEQRLYLVLGVSKKLQKPVFTRGSVPRDAKGCHMEGVGVNHQCLWDDLGRYPLVMTNIENWKITIEIVDCSMKNNDFPVRYFDITRGCLPKFHIIFKL